MDCTKAYFQQIDIFQLNAERNDAIKTHEKRQGRTKALQLPKRSRSN